MASIVVYFSHTGENYSAGGIKDIKTGHVETLAKMIAGELNAPLFRLVPLEPYPHNYQETVRRSKEEYDSGARPSFDEANMPDFAQYSDIYLGYPNWFGSFPRVIATFLDKVNLDGKAVHPFVTSGGSGISFSDRAIKSVAPFCDLCRGLAVNGDQVESALPLVKKWLGK